ncbi:hypothetical protein [Streptomyces sp. NPDC048349]|uniref:hypothetical protein n=1 Tax=Streptomyces sp. NPDC048349 TaxID=3155486 RepID=UPI00342854F5
MRRAWAAVAVAALVAATGVACVPPDAGTDQGGGTQTPSTRRPDGTPPESTRPTKPIQPTKPTPSATKDDAPGAATIIRVTPNHSDAGGRTYVACEDIRVDLTLKAFDGRSRWRARAVNVDLVGTTARTRPLTDALLARGVVLEPSSGVLETGQTRTLRIRGTYTPPPGTPRRFWVAVDDGYPSRTTPEFVCR